MLQDDHSNTIDVHINHQDESPTLSYTKPSLDITDPSLWLDKDQAAEFTKRNKETISKWVRKKNLEKNNIKVKYVKGRTGDEVRIFKPSLEKYLTELGEDPSLSLDEDQTNTTPDTTIGQDGEEASINPSQTLDPMTTKYIESLESQNEWLKQQIEEMTTQRGRDQVLMLNLQTENKQLTSKNEDQEEEIKTKKSKGGIFGLFSR